MPFPRPEVDIRVVPLEFDALIDWLEGWSYLLVLLEPFSLADIHGAMAAVDAAVRRDRSATDRWVAPLQSADEETARGARIVLSDHEWFETSLEQFEWFYRVVEEEDHGGHRQALGQYGRVLAEALRRHRGDEQWLGERKRHLAKGPSGPLGKP
jgi:hypothetical protein